ncbi:PstS family phosphate ABC transporter substrate-binding protein [Fibrella aquatilis]|uniref:Substrate-binding domain-containing protein n=1 Tax=Fibrella aquatilis TaxID=2817059 RepID=A0A939K404_9BACT|nr:substrate-binding domain-containing protein [Fibrella aquatilis]MBO0934885.1 substrate-binding domain-containing protein [Fibrella aquatilis]
MPYLPTTLRSYTLTGFVLLSLCLIGCEDKPKLDSPSQGRITIAADESYEPLTVEITRTYELLYPRTKFDLVFKPEREAIRLMLDDKARLCIVSRRLTANEQRSLDKVKVTGSATLLATDGVALITSKANTDSLMTMNELRGVFSKQISQWSQLKGGNQSGTITLVFDNPNSSNLDHVMQRFGLKNIDGLPIYTAKSNKGVIDYVRTHPTAMGFIGVNWISDGDGPVSAQLSKDIRVIGLSSKDSPQGRDDYHQPFQRDLALKLYPLWRDVYMVSREAHPGLGGGLTNYLVRDSGRLLVEKLGLWPRVPYNREVHLK